MFLPSSFFNVDPLSQKLKDFATRSLTISDESDERIPEIQDRRRWETNSHPYIFFNDDGVAMSFFGVYLDRNLNLILPESNRPYLILLDLAVLRQLYLYRISTMDLQFSK